MFNTRFKEEKSMDEKYYLHRISHESNTSYSLLEKNILTLGWSIFANSDILEAAREKDYPRFNPIVEAHGVGFNRSRWSIWYFARMEKGDKIVVPLDGGMFSVFEVEENAQSIACLEPLLPELYGAWNKHRMIWKDHRIYDEVEDRQIDLGFFIRVKPIVINVSRKYYAAGKLVSRMKIRVTNADITDIKEYVENAIASAIIAKPVSLYEQSIEALSKNLKKQIIDILDDNKFEKLIAWYVKKIGAEYSKIPAKNEPGKKDGADSDIVAEFKNLKHIIYIQAKHHKGETSGWAVHQIKEYFSQKADGDSDYSYAKWVVSTCDQYSKDAVKAAQEYNVRLIDGEEFARMLIDVGLMNIDKAYE